MDAETKKLYEIKANIIQAVSHPIRLAIADFLKNGEQCVCDIAKAIGAERSNVSRHLGVMLKGGVVGCRKDGLKMIYSLKTTCVLNFLACVSEVIREQIEGSNELLKKL